MYWATRGACVKPKLVLILQANLRFANTTNNIKKITTTALSWRYLAKLIALKSLFLVWKTSSEYLSLPHVPKYYIYHPPLLPGDDIIAPQDSISLVSWAVSISGASLPNNSSLANFTSIINFVFLYKPSVVQLDIIVVSCLVLLVVTSAAEVSTSQLSAGWTMERALWNVRAQGLSSSSTSSTISLPLIPPPPVYHYVFWQSCTSFWCGIVLFVSLFRRGYRQFRCQTNPPLQTIG